MSQAEWNVLLAYDDSPSARNALRWTAELTQRGHGTVHVVNVISSALEWELAAAQINPDPRRDERAHHLAGEWTAPLRDRAVDYRTDVVVGDPVGVLLDIARSDDADLLVVGSSHHGPLQGLLFGSVCHQLVHHATIPVVTVP